jgi:hypothetical protein
MYHTTGLSRDEIVDVCSMIHAATMGPGEKTWPPSLGLFKAVRITLTYLRRNHVQAELAEYYETSQPTISRAIAAITPLIKKVLTGFAPVAEDLDEKTQYLVDGTLLTCWSWRKHPELYSGKHKTTGLNVQVVADLATGELAWISDPVDGRHHDIYCLRESGVMDGHDPINWFGDKGYVGTGMVTPIKKPAHRELLEWEKNFNTQINQIRWKIEQVIAHIKTWRIFHTDYRRPLNTFAETISAVVGLHFWRLS